MSESAATPMTPPAAPARRKMTRRGFLILLGAGVTGLCLGVRVMTPALRLRAAQWLEASGGPPSNIDAPPTAWFDITPQGTVRLFLPKVEMGQGIHTALAQVAAEELELDWARLEVLHAPTGGGIEDPVATSASTSVSSLYLPIREAAATLRELMRAEAARSLNADPADVVIAQGQNTFALQSAPDRSVGFGELFARAAGWTLPEEPPALKPDSELRYIGQSLPRVDLRAKVTGEAVYGFDVRLPGMLYGAAARPRTIAGKLRSAKPGGAAALPGVVQVVIEDGFAGVVAESRVQAYQALEALDLDWDEGKAWQQAEIEEQVTVGKGAGTAIQVEGDTGATFKVGEVFEAEYRTPMAFHAYQEPLAAAADVTAGADGKPESAQVWASTQAPVGFRGSVAELLKLKEEAVIVHPVYLGGGFGRKIDETAALDAARLSRAVGKPVHVGLFRPQDFRNGYVRPPTHHRLRARVDEDGSIRAMEHNQASGEVALASLPAFVGTILGSDFGAWRGAMIQYGIANRQTNTWLAEIPVATGWWRGLGLFANIFAIESFIDELAHRAGADPLDFRLRHLPEGENGRRLERVLKAAAQKAGWGGSLPAGRGLGLACCFDARTVVAEIVEASVENNRVRVHRVTAAIDPGLPVNPRGVEAQTIGGITMGLSAALVEEVTVKDGAFSAANFDGYPLLRNADAPEIEVEVLKSGSSPYGVGEPPIGPVGAAVANAVFAATGKRIRRLPIRL